MLIKSFITFILVLTLCGIGLSKPANDYVVWEHNIMHYEYGPAFTDAGHEWVNIYFRKAIHKSIVGIGLKTYHAFNVQAFLKAYPQVKLVRIYYGYRDDDNFQGVEQSYEGIAKSS